MASAAAPLPLDDEALLVALASSLASLSTGVLHSLSPSALDSLLEHTTELLHSQQTLLQSLSFIQSTFKSECESQARMLAGHYTKLAHRVQSLQSLNARIVAVRKRLAKMKARSVELQNKTIGIPPQQSQSVPASQPRAQV